jgi:predicted naringenin-chalcone synthase
MKNVFLSRFHVEKPKNCLRQQDLLPWLIACHQAAETASDASEKMNLETLEKLFTRYSVKSSQIAQRYYELDDVFSFDFNTRPIYKIGSKNPQGVDIHARNLFFSERVNEVFRRFYDLKQNQTRPDHLIHVTCTGYISPSAAQKVVADTHWGVNTEITHAYHMGCYAAMPAVRLATSLVHSKAEANPSFVADIVHTEICGLHMNPLAQTPEQMVIQTLFADGHIKYTASSVATNDGKNLKVISVSEKLIPDSEMDMSWVPAAWGMQMNLSREVPTKIKAELREFTQSLFASAGRSLDQMSKCIFAVHPGGPKIIDAVQEVLELSESQIGESRKVLRERGNMSSATLPHVWSEILEAKYPVGTCIVSYAFGPGLTLFGSIFEVC